MQAGIVKASPQTFEMVWWLVCVPFYMYNMLHIIGWPSTPLISKALIPLLMSRLHFSNGMELQCYSCGI